MTSTPPTTRDDWLAQSQAIADALLQQRPHGDTPRWQAAIDALPQLAVRDIQLMNEVGINTDLEEPIREQLREQLMQLHPWRKGPFRIGDLGIDTEWHSDWKWQRLQPHLQTLQGRHVLDIGGGNGYYGWRLIGAGAASVTVVDPTRLFMMQFNAIKKLIGKDYPIRFLPLGIEHLPLNAPVFDTVLSMGVIYHRRDPIEHLQQLASLTRPGGEIVIETLVIATDNNTVLHPGDRYAQMRNVWAIPSPPALLDWLHEAGLRDTRIVDITPTTSAEQRRTDWMRFQSLQDFLDPRDNSRTIEGYPAPVRAIAIGLCE